MSDALDLTDLAPPSIGGALFLPGFEDLKIEDDPEGLESSAEMGNYTAVQFCKREPFRARLVLKLLARGVGQLEIAELSGVHVRTVRRLLESMPEEIATETERLNRRIRLGRKVAMESILQDLEDEAKMSKTPTRDKAVVLGILGDQLKSREAPVTINIQAPTHSDLAAFLSKLPQAGGQSSTLAGMGLTPEGENPKARPAWAAIEAEAVEIEGGDGAAVGPRAGDEKGEGNA
jgi:hypothetical protein